jgi:hypothetical protein
MTVEADEVKYANNISDKRMVDFRISPLKKRFENAIYSRAIFRCFRVIQ